MTAPIQTTQAANQYKPPNVGELLTSMVKMVAQAKQLGKDENILQQVEQAAVALVSGSPASLVQSFEQGPEDILGHSYTIVETIKVEFKPTSGS